MNIEVTQYIATNHTWTQELSLLRSFLLELSLEETIKWGKPAYLYKGKNILGIAAFKEYVCLWFHQGVFLQDEYQVLINAQEEKTKAMRQWRFYSIEDIDNQIVKKYVLEAIKNAEEGKALKPKRNYIPIEVPKELQEKFIENKLLQEKFENFSLSKKREFSEYITEAKREDTKQKRLEKIIPLILNSIGLYDKYR